MTQLKKSNKEIKVISINTLYEFAKQIFNYEKEHFSKFLGVNIFKVDGSLKAKFEHPRMIVKGHLTDGTYYEVTYYFTSSYNRFDIKITSCINGGSWDVRPTTAFCEYNDLTLTMFKTDNEGKLIETPEDIDYLDTRFNLDELKAIAEKIKEKAKEYEYEASKMNYIFRSVFDIERLCRN